MIGWIDLLHKGGWVAWVLAFLCLALWYAIGYRWLILGPGIPFFFNTALADESARNIIDKWKESASQNRNPELASTLELHNFNELLQTHSRTVRAVVMVAPLLGLLGTVIGMIETFDSLQDSALFSQSGGIAGGISQALITTQMGLVVAVPGLLIGRRFDKQAEEKQQQMQQWFKQANLGEIQ